MALKLNYIAEWSLTRNAKFADRQSNVDSSTYNAELPSPAGRVGGKLSLQGFEILILSVTNESGRRLYCSGTAAECENNWAGTSGLDTTPV